jgi:hypothetical protein
MKRALVLIAFLSSISLCEARTIVLHGEIHGTPECVRADGHLSESANRGEIYLFGENAFPEGYGNYYDDWSHHSFDTENLKNIEGLETPMTHAISTFFQTARGFENALAEQARTGTIALQPGANVQMGYLLTSEEPFQSPGLEYLQIPNAFHQKLINSTDSERQGLLRKESLPIIDSIRATARRKIAELLGTLPDVVWPPTAVERKLGGSVHMKGLVLEDIDEVILFRNDWMTHFLRARISKLDPTKDVHVILGASHVPHFKALLKQRGYRVVVDYSCAVDGLDIDLGVN